MKKMLAVAVALAVFPVAAQAQTLQYPGFYAGIEGGGNYMFQTGVATQFGPSTIYPAIGYSFGGMIGCTCVAQATPMATTAGRGAGGAGAATGGGAGGVGAMTTGAGGGVGVVAVMAGAGVGCGAICTSGGGMNGGGGASSLGGGGSTISGGGGGFLISSMTLVSIGARTTSTTFVASPVTSA